MPANCDFTWTWRAKGYILDTCLGGEHKEGKVEFTLKGETDAAGKATLSAKPEDIPLPKDKKYRPPPDTPWYGLAQERAVGKGTSRRALSLSRALLTSQGCFWVEESDGPTRSQ